LNYAFSAALAISGQCWLCRCEQGGCYLWLYLCDMKITAPSLQVWFWNACSWLWKVLIKR